MQSSLFSTIQLLLLYYLLYYKGLFLLNKAKEEGLLEVLIELIFQVVLFPEVN